MRSIWLIWCVAALAILGSCTGAATNNPTGNGDAGDTSTSRGAETWTTPSTPDTTVWGPETTIEPEVYVPQPGELGASCNDNSECFSGLCIAHPEGGYICTKTCDQDCPAGYLCKSTAPWRGDVMFICTPEISVLCQSCVNDTDCGGSEHLCMSIGLADEVQFCGRGCQDDDDCPAEYACEEGTTWDGETARQCLPKTGSCICDADLNATGRPCSASNEWGTCYGDETCAGALGWSGCTAPVPALEACDGVDNDCDGDTDEGHAPSPCVKQNDAGTCNGVRSCHGEVGLVCDALEPSDEACDGVDNNCDGYTDEVFDDTDEDGAANCVDDDDDNDER
ncbi:MAG: MopE-related protein, partial [Myxococcota bacterium]|nr:MopE-related protein [Myxococcota bacterium]